LFFFFCSKAVYFDGLLPSAKQSTRLSRLQGYANQLVTFRALHKEDLPARREIVTNTSKLDVLSAVASSNPLKALPAPPFLVPAVIEMLLESRYSPSVSVIPGEADAYCAEAAREFGGVIFTSDSDLLVHDLGVSGKVILYRHLEAIHLPSRGKCLKTQQYHPAAIAQRFSLSNLVKLAFFMSQDHHKSISENVRLAAKDTPMSSGFAEFAEQYASLPKFSRLNMAETAVETTLSATLARLDPRISEIVHLISLENKDDVLPADSGDYHNLNMYLPFIIDDPTRSSAWRAGASIRLQAYMLLRLLNPHITHVTEFERKGTRIAGTVAPLTEETSNSPTTTLQDCTNSLQHTLNQQPQQLSNTETWRTVAAQFVCLSNLENDKPPPHSNDLVRLVTAAREGILSWPFIHASAQLQSCLYSLRMLFQVANLVYILLENSSSNQELLPPLKELVTLLNNLPSLRELLDEELTKESSISRGGGGDPGAEQLVAAKTAVATILHNLGITPHVTTEETPSSTKKMKKKKCKKMDEHTASDRTSPPSVPWRGNNMFSNLA
jgi:hypothetical protein